MPAPSAATSGILPLHLGYFLPATSYIDRLKSAATLHYRCHPRLSTSTELGTLVSAE